jgi:hypothetical protein
MVTNPENEAGPSQVQSPAAVVPAASPTYGKEETCFGKIPLSPTFTSEKAVKLNQERTHP